MPEGDTVHALARLIRPRLEGEELVGCRLRKLPDFSLEGARVRDVRALGKHLLTELEVAGGGRGVVLRVHLGLHGSWHRYEPGERWLRREHEASVVLETKDDVLVCFSAKEVECLALDGLRLRDLERHLGPDLCAGSCDLDEVIRRLQVHARQTTLLGDALLDQRIAAGIGNVFKNEVMFLERLAPSTRMQALDEARARAIWSRARALLRANLSGGPRVTRVRATESRGASVWVYERGGAPCFECGTRIRVQRGGRSERWTWWCPACQR